MIEIKSKYPIKGYLESKIGGRPENQDACSFQDTPLGLLVLVCDGMGGLNGGSTASSMAVHSIIADLMAANEDGDPVEAIVDAVNHANTEIIQAGVSNPSLAGMGTTLTLLLLTPLCAYSTYVGDSRVYQLRGKEKVYRSFDHSVVFQLVRQGVITEEQARLSSQSNVIMQALGVKESLDFIVEQHPYEKGDRFALCTDGFWGSMSEVQILARLCAKKPVGNIVYESVLEIDGKGVSQGSHHDNLTIALLEVKSDSILKVKMSRKAKIILAALCAALIVSLVFNIISPFKKPALPKDVAVQELSNDNKELGDRIKSLESAATLNEQRIKELEEKKGALEESVKNLENENKKLADDNKQLKERLRINHENKVAEGGNPPEGAAEGKDVKK